MDKIGHFFRWIFLDKESNTWKDYCLKNGLVKEEPKVETKEEPKTIILEKSTDKKETEKPVKKEAIEEAKDLYLFPYFSTAEKIEKCKQIICNYTYDCSESKAAVADLLNNNRDKWYIVSGGLDGKSKLITEALEYLTKKKWEYLGEVESSIYGWRVDYSKMLDKEYEKNI
jgi:hypothetical protein